MEIRIKDILISVDESKQKIAVKRAMVGFLKTRYMSRDGLEPQSHIKYDRSVVTEDVVYEVVSEMEKQIKEEESRLIATLQEKING